MVQVKRRKLEAANFSCVLRLENFADAGERVDFGGGLVRAQARDTRKPKGKAAVVALRALDIVEGDFEDDCGLDVGEAGGGFADVDEPVAVAHGERVIGEEAATLAVAVFSDGDYHVERGKRALELHPELAAAAGDIGRFWRFGEEAFVTLIEGE